MSVQLHQLLVMAKLILIEDTMETWIALAGLAFTIIGQIALFSYLTGALFQRVKSLEDKSENDHDVKLATIETNIMNFKTWFEKLETSIEKLMELKQIELNRLTSLEAFVKNQISSTRRVSK